jgi:hypothetical protein
VRSCTAVITRPIPSSMIFSDLQLVDDNPSWSLVLGAYRALELEAAEARAAERKKAMAGVAEQPSEAADEESTPVPAEVENDRWMARLFDIEGVENEELSTIHGQLIAHGFLRFELSGRDGLVYQLTNLAKQAIVAPEDRAPVEHGGDSLPQAA